MTAMFTPIRDTAEPPAIEVRSRLHAAHALMGRVGKINLTYSVGEDAVECYATHWVQHDKYSHHDCIAIPNAYGTLSDCLAAVERYAAERAANAQQEAA
ncbi:hypothetical protein Sp245p_03365 [Azospirillum baldaniorum]|uniref:Uncharacterized protein n=1 Tax=Azospirillum baldaniorum TaxID=1064539 RepID=A0A9P1JTC1_9PROT|nr:hypothetical protein [Azospirillum baldaniorum]AWJ88893.1 hypothetical protein Sp245p_03365 [Azospirillum baldaniorum]TWA73396.1 hypothetical protein FBZ85_11688 [Azospirillum brasilense]CCC99400.1 protein of unknown function [Azospirillum baldaniorum]